LTGYIRNSLILTQLPYNCETNTFPQSVINIISPFSSEFAAKVEWLYDLKELITPEGIANLF
jgi:hypothetical protein